MCSPCCEQSDISSRKSVSAFVCQITDVQYQPNTSLLNISGNSSLIEACEEGNLCMVQYLLLEGHADINCRGRKGRTPALTAAINGQVAVIKFLLTLDCDLKLTDVNKRNVLHVACIKGNLDIVRIFAKLEYKLETKDINGMTPLMKAVVNNHVHVVEFLINSGSDLTATDAKQSNVLHLTCISGYVKMLKLILSKNILSTESRRKRGLTPLMVSAFCGHIETFEILINNGANVEVLDDVGDNVLHSACLADQLNMVKHIISKQIISIDTKGQHGRTPLMKAAGKGYIKLVEYLVSKGCDVSVVDNQKNNILHLASFGGHVDVVEYILAHNLTNRECRGFRGRTSVMFAASFGHMKIFDMLVYAGCNVTAVDNDGDSSLHLACSNGYIDMVKHILLGHFIDINSKGYKGQTPVMKAAEMGHTEIVRLLVRHGCHLRISDFNMNNILHLACGEGQLQTVKYLTTLADVDRKQKNKYGMTPAQLAKHFGHINTVAVFNNSGI